MQIKKTVFGLFTLLFLIGGLCYLIGNFYFSKTTVFEEYWNIEFPNNYRIEYNIDKTGSIQGDGVVIIKLIIQDEFTFIKSFDDENNNELEIKINNILKEENIDSYYFPDFTIDYSWKMIEKEQNYLYAIFFKGTNSVYLISEMF